MSQVPADRPPKRYEQIKQFLMEGIASGRWAEGEKIPSEHELVELLGASRMTVNRAVREVSAQGFLRRVQGQGSFVRQVAPRSALLEIYDIAEDIQRRGHVHGVRVLRLEAVPAEARMAALFSLERGAWLFHSELVHAENGQPVQLETRHVLPRFAPHYLAQDYTQVSTSRYLQSLEAPAEVEHIVHAVAADARVQALLGIGADEPCLRVERRTWTAQGAATCSVLTHPGSRYSLGSRYRVAEWEARRLG